MIFEYIQIQHDYAKKHPMFLVLLVGFLCMAACDLPPLPPEPEKNVPAVLEPETLLLGTPNAETTERNATFLFACDQPDGCRFECRMDDQAYFACESPTLLENLNYGEHQFFVRAIDDQNRIDTTPAAFSWLLTKNGAGSHITSLEIEPFSFNRMTVTFECSSNDCRYQCQLDDGQFFDCESPLTLERVDSGEHLFKVQAYDLNEILVPDSDTQDFNIEDLWMTVSTRSAHTCGLRTDGKIFCWGLNHLGQQGNEVGGVSALPSLFNQDNDWMTVQTGARHTCALKSDDSLWCWGANHDGNLATGGDIEGLIKCEADSNNPEVLCLSTEPLRVPTETSWEQVAVGWQHTCAIDAQKSLWCWGKNDAGQIGDGTRTTRSLPYLVSDANWKHIAAGTDATCGIQDNGTLHCWGQWHLNQSATTPFPINTDSEWESVSASGAYELNTFCAIKTDASLWCFGDNNNGSLGLGDNPNNTNNPQLVAELDKTLQVSVGPSHTCAVNENNELWCWGKNDQGQIGNNLVWGTQNQSHPKYFETEQAWQQITTGISHNCGITTAGKLYCWGQNYYGATGTSDTAQLISNWGSLDPETIQWETLAAAGNSACGLKSDDSLWCWGKNGQSPLGNYSNYHLQQPAQVGVFQWRHLSVGKHHACAIQGDDSLYCWGENNYNQISPTSESSYASPFAVSDAIWEHLSVGMNHACGIQDSGDLYCWGNNENGQSGQLPSSSIAVPTKITHDTHWQKISSGAQHTCAIASDQTLWCWGNNSKGQLGLPTSSLIQSATPRQVIADNVTAFTHLAVGDQHTCALDEEQSLWCWGVNDKGQCGNSSSENGMLTPMRVGNNTTWTELAAGADITCAIRQSGSLFCWGAIIFNEALPDSVLHVETPTLMDNNHHYVHVEAGDGFIIALDQEGYRYGRGKNNYGQLGNNSAWRLQPTLLSIPNTSP